VFFSKGNGKHNGCRYWYLAGNFCSIPKSYSEIRRQWVTNQNSKRKLDIGLCSELPKHCRLTCGRLYLAAKIRRLPPCKNGKEQSAGSASSLPVEPQKPQSKEKHTRIPAKTLLCKPCAPQTPPVLAVLVLQRDLSASNITGTPHNPPSWRTMRIR
jgi:hypothetical protein